MTPPPGSEPRTASPRCRHRDSTTARTPPSSPSSPPRHPAARRRPTSSAPCAAPRRRARTPRCVRPLFSTGIDTIATALRQWRPGRPLEEAFDHVWARDAALPGPDVGALLRLTRSEPGLRAVWLQTHDEAEPAFARALAERAGLPADDVRPAIRAAMLNAALRAAVEHHAYRTTEPDTDPATARADLAATLRTALAVTAAGLT
ncbi:hypothetical protein [Streptomyces sp. NPDC045251]|uniref:acyl-CoA-like ligand-binding transcription factor n=1 Tax=unclassified Streptomyces TaxID=2593676 RepID=UPI0033D06877